MLRNAADPGRWRFYLPRQVSASGRSRAFRKDVGTSFESWRRQTRLTRAVELLVSGYSIKEVAARSVILNRELLWKCRRTFGATPKAWISALETLAESRIDHF